jgi:uncharacterized protein (TIGR02246 family)
LHDQQTNTPDPQLRLQIVARGKKCDEAENNNDAAALAALLTENAVFVTPGGPLYGRQGIENRLEDASRRATNSILISALAD